MDFAHIFHDAAARVCNDKIEFLIQSYFVVR
jgi:hypothetical protein